MEARSNKNKCIFSVDVEDWFHILDISSSPDITEWDFLPSRVEKNFMRLLDIFSLKDIQVTCFFLGYIGKKFPNLVKEAFLRGHEIASHGYNHRLIYQMTPQEFFNDIVKSKFILEDIIGNAVIGYRSAGFSVTEETPWFYEKLIESNFRYSSSVFPAARGHGGLKKAKYPPHCVNISSTQFLEFPITVIDCFGKALCFFGGGYLRLFPYSLVKFMANRVLKEERPVIFYVHPREIDPYHPKLPMNIKRRFKSYVNLHSTERKILQILEDFKFCTFQQYIFEHSIKQDYR